MRKTVLGFAAIAALASTPALAGTATNNMPVSVNVINSCTVSATPMAFGTLTAIGGVNVDTTSDVSLTCTQGAAYDVALNGGVNSSLGQRRMNAGANYVPYNVYSNAARTTAWGSTSGTDTVSGTAGASAITLTAYGRIPSSAASVPAGSYTDTITVTVTF